MFKILTKPVLPTFLRRYAVSKAKIKHTAVKSKLEDTSALIQCKRSNFNLFQHIEAHCKFGSVPLASSGWMSDKSKGDWFQINATISEEEKSQQMVEVQQFLQNSGLKFDSILVENLKNEFEIKSLTNIQCQGWPILRENQHLLIAAETGCGKTLCYLMPMIQNIVESKPRMSEKRKLNSPVALIVTPGRELASQIGEVIKKLTRNLDVNVKTILGGNTKQLILNPEFGEVDVLVASVGALSKLVTTGIYRTQFVKHVVLDEADTLFDDSFSEKLVHFLTKFPFHKNLSQNADNIGTQLILASATMPTNTSELLQRVIDVETIQEVVSPHLHKIMPHVEQRFTRVNKSDRPSHLLALVKKELLLRKPVIIFSNKTPTCDFISIFLNNSGVNCINLNGDMLMKIRVGRFDKFQNGECDVLSTTDVGSRGLDTTRARHVINFDFPLHVSDYIHRCGRIGRVGNIQKCLVTNLISSRREIDVVQRIEHAARCGGLLPDVNANIKNIINKKILKEMKAEGMLLPNQNQDEIF